MRLALRGLRHQRRRIAAQFHNSNCATPGGGLSKRPAAAADRRAIGPAGLRPPSTALGGRRFHQPRAAEDHHGRVDLGFLQREFRLEVFQFHPRRAAWDWSKTRYRGMPPDNWAIARIVQILVVIKGLAHQHVAPERRRPTAVDCRRMLPRRQVPIVLGNGVHCREQTQHTSPSASEGPAEFPPITSFNPCSTSDRCHTAAAHGGGS